MSSVSVSPATEVTSQWDLQANDPRERVPLVLGDNDFTTVTDTVTEIAMRRTPPMWYVAMTISLSPLRLATHARTVRSLPVTVIATSHTAQLPVLHELAIATPAASATSSMFAPRGAFVETSPVGVMNRTGTVCDSAAVRAKITISERSIYESCVKCVNVSAQ